MMHSNLPSKSQALHGRPTARDTALRKTANLFIGMHLSSLPNPSRRPLAASGLCVEALLWQFSDLELPAFDPPSLTLHRVGSCSLMAIDHFQERCQGMSTGTNGRATGKA